MHSSISNPFCMLWYSQKQFQEKNPPARVAPSPLDKVPRWAGERQPGLPAAEHCCKETLSARDKLKPQPFKKWWRLNIGEQSTMASAGLMQHAACAPTEAQSHDRPLKQQFLSYGLSVENVRACTKSSWSHGPSPPSQQSNRISFVLGACNFRHRKKRNNLPQRQGVWKTNRARATTHPGKRTNLGNSGILPKVYKR